MPWIAIQILLSMKICRIFVYFCDKYFDIDTRGSEISKTDTFPYSTFSY